MPVFAGVGLPRIGLRRWVLAGMLIGGVLAATGCRPRSDAHVPPPAVVEAVNRGVALMGQYDYDAATTAFADALAAAPDLGEVKVNLAIARFNRGKKDQQDTEHAIALLDAAIQQDPANARAWYFKSIVLQHLGQAEAAVPCLEKVLQLRPDDGVAWYLLGICKQRLGQDAQQELLRAIELRPYLVSAYYRVWQTLQAAGQTQRAAPYLEQFKKLREHPLAETIELPQYNQMGDLALVVPVGDTPPAPPARSIYRAGAARELFEHPAAAPATSDETPAHDLRFGGAAIADTNRNETPEILLTGWPTMPLVAGLRIEGDLMAGSPSVAAVLSGELPIVGAVAYAVGDYDNDETPDLFVVGPQGNALFRGAADGRFTRVPGAWEHLASGGTTRSALWLDADHDGDLDLLLCNAGAPNQLFNNNSDGTFAEIAAAAGLADRGDDSLLALPGDLDGDRDQDLVLLRAHAPAKLLLNELSGRFREAEFGGLAIHGELGGVLQDFTGDGLLDLLVLGGQPAELKLFVGDGKAHFRLSDAFGANAPLSSDPGGTPMPRGTGVPPVGVEAAASNDLLRGFRIADVDLDGDLDIAVFGREGHLLLNDGSGRFALQARTWTAPANAEIVGAELTDLTGDLVPDLLLLERGAASRVLLVPGMLSPASSAIAIAPTGVRSRDKRTRSPASGYGTTVTVRTGLQEHARLASGQSGGFNQSPRPLVFGLGGTPRADYVKLLWSDGVAQMELPLAAGQTHVLAETQRKISSCPVLFTWNGHRYEFITDFAGVGGMGYLAAPGEYSYPQPLDHVKIAPEQLRARDGCFEIRITEPMEESAYVDRLELQAIDHPADWVVFPDERLTVTGSPPTHGLLAVAEPIYPRRAVNPAGEECAHRLRRADRAYAFAPTLDRRFFGFGERHTLTLDFGAQLDALPPGEPVWLFINGYLEYPYSQTTYAAAQADVTWEAIRVERRQPDGTWQTIVPDAGALGGMSRTMTVYLTGLLDGRDCQLRLTSNLEIYYDQIFLGVPVQSDRVQVHALPVAAAELRYLGFPREVSPDGRLPLIYDYQEVEPAAPFHSLRGSYTRYGDVRELLTEFDDAFVLMNSGDEIAARFDATPLPPLAAGMTRSFVLVSHAYCKDMDLYTATPQTLDPMPFRGMSRYPYPAGERPPETAAQRRAREAYQTRIVP